MMNAGFNATQCGVQIQTILFILTDYTHLESYE